MIVATPEKMREYDDYAITKWGIPSAVLMENAGRSTYRLLKEEYLKGRRRVAIFCGHGNNGGDGFVVARYALRDGFETEVFLLADPSSLKGDALLNMDLYCSLGGRILPIEGDPGRAAVGLKKCDLIVDAIFGTGLAKEVRGAQRAVIEGMNASGKPIIAIDIPSGLDGERGIPLGVAVKATHTYTYGSPKVGQLLHPGVTYRGKLTVIDIGLPSSAHEESPAGANLVDGAMLRGFYRGRPPEAHKGMFGHLVVIAGSIGKTGAAVMASTAALKIGAGLVTLVCPASLNPIVAGKLVEAMTYPVDDGDRGFLTEASYEGILEFASHKDVVVLGPGLGRSEETMALVRKLYVELDLPFVIDADGINAFVGHLDLLKEKGGKTLLTPHPGEFGRLVAMGVKEVNADRLNAGRAFALEHKASLVLKGAPTITFSEGGEAFFNPTGNPALSKGGTGDVLTGFIGGLASQGYEMQDAALLAVYLHGYIADTWALEHTEMDLMAQDLISGLGDALRDVRNGTDRVYVEASL